MSSYFYYPGGEGKRFCYAKAPTFTCPYSQLKVSTTDETWEVPEAFVQAAGALDVLPEHLLRIVVRGHRNNRRARNGAGKLTDRCDNCGHRMERAGFRCWIEQISERSDAGAQLTRIMGGVPTVVLKTLYLDTKREAQTWAREEAQLSKEIDR